MTEPSPDTHADHLNPCSIDLARVNVHLCLLRVIAVKTLPEKKIVRYGMRTGDLVESFVFSPETAVFS